jgi:predicted  nucleic acid-binding Zn-ribbon protein
MPPVNQGSRTALITWTVAMSIACVTAVILCFYFYIDASHAREALTTAQTKYKDIIAEGALNSSDVSDAKTLRGTGGFNPNASVVDVLLKERDDLAKLAAGDADYSKAVNSANNTIQTAMKRASTAGGATMPSSGNLSDTVNALSNALTARQTEVDNLKTQLADANKKLQANAGEIQAMRQAMDQQLAQVRAQADAATAAAGTDRTSKDEQLKKISSDFDAQLKAATENINQQQVQIGDLNKQINDKNIMIAQLQQRLGDIRPNVANMDVRQADGKITSLPGNGVAYIDLGSGDHVVPGMTFEVYDRAQGVPPPGDPATIENLPAGKGSIEVLRVGPTNTECRVVKTQLGQNINEGDIIANVVYDKNHKNAFYVYGNFDLTKDGPPGPNDQPRPQDAEVIKRLIKDWGGTVVDKINVNTDFVVIGKEPVVPEYTKEQLNDPLMVAAYNKSQDELQKYDAVVDQAKALHIPILNQPRFLYMTGYYDMSKR